MSRADSKLNRKQMKKNKKRWIMWIFLLMLISTAVSVSLFHICRDLGTKAGFNQQYFTPKQNNQSYNLLFHLLTVDGTFFSGTVYWSGSSSEIQVSDNGEFVITDVTPGTYRIRIMDGQGNQIAVCDIQIVYQEKTNEMTIRVLEKGYYRIQAGESKQPLECYLILNQDYKSVELFSAPREEPLQSEQNPTDKVQDNQPDLPSAPSTAGINAEKESAVTETIPETQISNTLPSRNDGGSSSGSSSGGSVNTPTVIPKTIVLSEGTEWTQSTQINLFGAQILYPGISGEYAFTIKNDGFSNAHIFMQITNLEVGNQLPLHYRLKTSGGVYVLGDYDTWLSAAEMAHNQLEYSVAARTSADFKIEWKWNYEESTSQNMKDTSMGSEQNSNEVKVTVRVERDT